MRRRRSQLGQLYHSGEGNTSCWYGRFYIHGTNRRGEPATHRRRKRIGLCFGMSKKVARRKLLEIIAEEQLKEDQKNAVRAPASDSSFRIQGRELALTPMMRGACAELIVAADLMWRGFDVFQSLNPRGPCDLLCLKNGGLATRIEVKWAAVDGAGKPLCDLSGNWGKFDILAVTGPDRVVRYFDQSLNEIPAELGLNLPENPSDSSEAKS